jgi:Universal stress protein UspA and related nucleotide-binding proteins
VGVDGSANSDLALDWAVDEATRRGLPLHIIHGIPYRSPMTRLGIGYEIDGLRQLAAGVRKDAIARVDRANPELVVTWDQSTYGPASALVDASDTADTVVVGARGMSRGMGVLMGSVSIQVAAHADCPVVVVRALRASADAEAAVVVGVDGSASSELAIAFAFEQARSRGVGLTAVHAWRLDHIEGAFASSIWTVDWPTFAQGEQILVAESLAGWREKYPDVAVRQHSLRGLPVEALIRASENACLVVVGTRGRGGFGGLLLGSVSQGVMHGAQCPVAIAHGPRESPSDGRTTDTVRHLVSVPAVHEHS